MLKVNKENSRLMDKLRAAIREAKKLGKYSPNDNKSLLYWLRFLNRYGGGENQKAGSVCELYLDFAPLSFGFHVRCVRRDGSIQERGLVGGLIFHGSHDGFGSGSFPTLSVTLTPHDGWTIHT